MGNKERKITTSQQITPCADVFGAWGDIYKRDPIMTIYLLEYSCEIYVKNSSLTNFSHLVACLFCWRICVSGITGKYSRCPLRDSLGCGSHAYAQQGTHTHTYNEASYLLLLQQGLLQGLFAVGGSRTSAIANPHRMVGLFLNTLDTKLPCLEG